MLYSIGYNAITKIDSIAIPEMDIGKIGKFYLKITLFLAMSSWLKKKKK